MKSLTIQPFFSESFIGSPEQTSEKYLSHLKKICSISLPAKRSDPDQQKRKDAPTLFFNLEEPFFLQKAQIEKLEELSSSNFRFTYYCVKKDQMLQSSHFLLVNDQQRFQDFALFQTIPEENLNDLNKRALFLDRDGILIHDTHYPHKVSDLHLKEEVVPLLKKATANGLELIILSNQSGVAKGKFTLKELENFHQAMLKEFQDRYQIQFLDAFYCPYHPDGKVKDYAKMSSQRKPEPGMLIKAIRKWNIDPHLSFMIGDKLSDELQLLGPKYALLQSEYIEQKKNNVFENFKEIENYFFQ
ncbi:MAG: D-glycero-alpha-D-manno-heptose-1,7-bisphosphate 7-phosphatase [Bacteriovoracaceae bacterium]